MAKFGYDPRSCFRVCNLKLKVNNDAIDDDRCRQLKCEVIWARNDNKDLFDA